MHGSRSGGVGTKVLVADLLLIFLNPYRHTATCEQLDAAKANRLARISGPAADESDDQSVRLVRTDEL